MVASVCIFYFVGIISDNSLNPLHCGAVVASPTSFSATPVLAHVSIPFIAGQWSLQFSPACRRRAGFRSQSPSLRGSGRFSDSPRTWSFPQPLFQSPSLRGSGRFDQTAFREGEVYWEVFQSPSLRGSGRFRGKLYVLVVSVPTFQSPSLRGSGRFGTTSTPDPTPPVRFNPLHCGAVVASRRRPGRKRRTERVSIPFIAGQWSLRVDERTLVGALARVSIPFIAGQWSLPPQRCCCGGRRSVSIPFIAGQWSLLEVSVARLDDADSVFQSPSLRGSGRFLAPIARGLESGLSFNPLHCGAVVASRGPR